MGITISSSSYAVHVSVKRTITVDLLDKVDLSDPKANYILGTTADEDKWCSCAATNGARHEYDAYEVVNDATLPVKKDPVPTPIPVVNAITLGVIATTAAFVVTGLVGK